MPGLTGDNTKGYVNSVVTAAYERGWDVVLINHRGLGGARLTTPRLYSASSWPDAGEAIEHIYKKFPKSKLLGLGISMGANTLSNLLGEQGSSCLLTAAVAFASPLNFTGKELSQNCFGIFDKALGKSFFRLYQTNSQMMAPHIKQTLNIDLDDYIAKTQPSI